MQGSMLQEICETPLQVQEVGDLLQCFVSYIDTRFMKNHWMMRQQEGWECRRKPSMKPRAPRLSMTLASRSKRTALIGAGYRSCAKRLKMRLQVRSVLQVPHRLLCRWCPSGGSGGVWGLRRRRRRRSKEEEPPPPPPPPPPSPPPPPARRAAVAPMMYCSRRMLKTQCAPAEAARAPGVAR